jgi:hypothetical protein
MPLSLLIQSTSIDQTVTQEILLPLLHSYKD